MLANPLVSHGNLAPLYFRVFLCTHCSILALLAAALQTSALCPKPYTRENRIQYPSHHYFSPILRRNVRYVLHPRYFQLKTVGSDSQSYSTIYISVRGDPIQRRPPSKKSLLQKIYLSTIMSALAGNNERAERLRRNLQNVRPPVPSRSSVSAVYTYARQFQQ